MKSSKVKRKAQGGLVDSAPEQAIADTVRNPQAARMLDIDAANFALMQQPQRMAGGGAVVHMDKGGKPSKEDLMNLKPQPKAQDTSFASVRSLLADIGSNQEEYERIAQGGAFDRRKFTPENIYAMRLLQAANATPDPARYLEALNPYLDSQLQFELNPFTREAGYVSKSEPNKVVIQRLEEVANTIPHELTHTLQLGKGANPNFENNTQAFVRARGLPAEMRKSVFPSANVDNIKEVWANVNARAHEVNAAGGDFINSPEGKALFPTNTEQRDYYTNAMPGVNSITPDTGTFVPNNESYLAKAKRRLGMAEGGQASLDQMRYELDRANSPVLQATPRGPVQSAIGTLGGYIDRAGKFVSEAIEPTAERNPVKHFLADMILAAPLKGMGTALQDYTGTVRETDEDNPVRGVISKDFRNLTTSREPMIDPRVLDMAQFAAPVITGATKLAGAGVKAITPFATRVDDMVRELYASGAMPQPGLSIKDVTPKALAPASDIGFYSPTEAAALNVQRKSGAGQAFLNDIMKGENVKSDEISGMGLDTFLKGRTSVTAAEVQDYIAQNKLGLGESVYGGKITEDPVGMAKRQEIFDAYNPAIRQAYADLNTSYNHSEIYARIERLSKERDKKADAAYKMPEPRRTQFDQYAITGGENYREVVLTLPDPKDAMMDQVRALGITKNKDSITINDILQRGGSDELAEGWQNASKNTYKSSHFDEPNVLAHLRMSDRVTDGKKTLLVDEVQSDWHQEGREQGYAQPETARLKGEVVPDESGTYKVVWEDGTFSGGYSAEGAAAKAAEGKSNAKKGVPDAPYKEDWYQLALRRAVKEAVDGGYDRVALPTGARVNERFDLSKQIDRIDYNKNDDGTYNMSAIKDGQEVFAKEGLDEKELSGIIGKDVAKKIVGDEGSSAPKADRWEAEDGDVPEFKSLSGLDLKIGGEGNKKYYDEIYPTYLKKFGKKYGSQSGMTTVDAGGTPEPLHYMDITPAMRKEFSTGIHMKRGGKVHFASNLDAMRHELTQRR